jgi:hypothetical protein
MAAPDIAGAGRSGRTSSRARRRASTAVQDASTAIPNGRGFIHVHHLQPLSEAGGGETTDPEKDLVPVCPNCHYMLHRGDNLLSPEELRELLPKELIDLLRCNQRSR